MRVGSSERSVANTSRAEAEPKYEHPADEVSILALVNVLLRRRRQVAMGVLLGGLVALLIVTLKVPKFTASSSFVPSGGDRGRTSGLSNLAGQLGMSLPVGDQAQSPEFYSDLLRSKELLGGVARDSVRVPELGNKWTSMPELLDVNSGSRQRDLEDAATRLGQLLTTSVTKTTGVVNVSVSTPWPSVSLAIVDRLVKGVNDFNLRTRQSQATAERRFLEGRLKVAEEDLRRAEERLEAFLRTNRQLGGSPELAFARERLQREVTLQEQVLTSFSRGYEEARIREVRDTPVITTVDSPSVSTRPDPRRRGVWLLIGLAVGAILSSGIAFIAEGLRQGRSVARPEVEEFLAHLSHVSDRIRPGRFKRPANSAD